MRASQSTIISTAQTSSRVAMVLVKRLDIPLSTANNLLQPRGQRNPPPPTMMRAPAAATTLPLVHLSKGIDLPDELEHLVLQNLTLIERVCSNSESSSTDLVRELLLESPGLLVQPSLQVWNDFLESYGCSTGARRKLFAGHPEVIQGNIHTAGISILIFRSHGWSNHDIRERIIHLYPMLLTVSLDQFQKVLKELSEAGCEGEQLRRLIWEFPRIFIRSSRKRIAQFARLGLYGMARNHELSQ